MDSNDQIKALNELIETTLDSVNGYEDSAKNIDNERLRETFRQRADERQQVVQELRTEVRRLGGDPEESGSLLGKAHQRFEDLKAAITGRDEKAAMWDLRIEDKQGNSIEWENLNLLEISKVTLNYKDGKATAQAE